MPPTPLPSQVLYSLAGPVPPPVSLSLPQAQLVERPIMWPPPSLDASDHPGPPPGRTRISNPYQAGPYSRQGPGYFTGPPPPPEQTKMNLCPRPLDPSPRHRRVKR
ncbi:hypothetical protein E1B28_006358 [Marasmius oreades]|uniref:Uncharacterized protein n=1 Tax=Marasmius oreades TaxID=181124 RepID=A0A9P7S5Q5_9AGAR|nr:uncharacterized protein E1B28_006358 [Marasmius oreades]KAG7095635.1 hypothetical protein E1B28_006358 [Marasmius oreades]